jgi:hypothetical protein
MFAFEMARISFQLLFFAFPLPEIHLARQDNVRIGPLSNTRDADKP